RAFYGYHSPKLEREIMGIKFRNPIGLAAGIDKNGEICNQFSNFGFGFIEIGSVTPLPQPGNPKPRCFRLVKDRAIINRFGINNKGVKQVVQNLQQRAPRPGVIIGGNISKNTLTPNEEAANDYEKAFVHLYEYVDYFTINVSCPNVQDLCKLHDITLLSCIIDRLTEIRRNHDTYRPMLLKVSPDLSFAQLDEVIELVLVSGLDGMVATNTTTDRDNLTASPKKIDALGHGGLSGAPLKARSLEVIRYIHEKTKGHLPIIGVGGIMTPQDVLDMLDAGASLVQIYTGFIYNGPGLVKQSLKKITKPES
ncbi:MAG: quinone-dependent dihydroorotate dehydrogenase, partial [Bacteroidetes bacterium]|nr:quinone-dependent dihydroorotate dehydrogenase [Bacteroidota bacterium]